MCTIIANNDDYFFISRWTLWFKSLKLLLFRLKGQTLFADVDPSVVCCPSRGHISETKQNRPIVTMEHYYEAGTADSVVAFRSPIRRPANIFCFQIKRFSNINMASCSTSASDHNCCQPIISSSHRGCWIADRVVSSVIVNGCWFFQLSSIYLWKKHKTTRLNFSTYSYSKKKHKWLTKNYSKRTNKNLVIANRSRVSCAHNTLRTSIKITITPWPWNL